MKRYNINLRFLWVLSALFFAVPWKSLAQNDITLHLSETSINQTLQTLIDAKAASFAKYTSSYGVSNFNINTTSASVNLKNSSTNITNSNLR